MKWNHKSCQALSSPILMDCKWMNITKVQHTKSCYSQSHSYGHTLRYGQEIWIRRRREIHNSGGETWYVKRKWLRLFPCLSFPEVSQRKVFNETIRTSHACYASTISSFFFSHRRVFWSYRGLDDIPRVEAQGGCWKSTPPCGVSAKGGWTPI